MLISTPPRHVFAVGINLEMNDFPIPNAMQSQTLLNLLRQWHQPSLRGAMGFRKLHGACAMRQMAQQFLSAQSPQNDIAPPAQPTLRMAPGY
jgi:hypothetical protein